MKVAHILANTVLCSGAPRVAFSLASVQSSLGIDVSCWGAYDQKQWGDRSDLPCFPSHSFPTGWPSSWLRSPALIEALSARIAEFDIFHLHQIWSHPQLASGRLARRKGVPYVLIAHGELEPWRVRNKGLKKNLYLRLLGRRMLNGATCLQAITPLEVGGFRQAGYRGPITIVPNGIDPSEFSDLPDPHEADVIWPALKGRRVVLFLSRLSQEKGLNVLIEAWTHLVRQDRYQDAILVVAGSGERRFEESLFAQVAELQHPSRIVFTGTVRGREKKALLARADLYTLPSYSEGFSMAILENLAAGNPVVITPGCNFPEVAEMGAGLCVPPKSEALEEALRRLLDMSDADRAAMGSRGRDLVRHNYTWEIAARKMITVYRCILEGKEIPLHPEPAKASRAAA